MSGKIEVKVRKGIPKRRDLKYYPYWSWEVTDENDSNKKVIITPNWMDIKSALLNTIKHELKVDLAINRKPDTRRYMKTLKEISDMVTSLETEIKDFMLEAIYTDALK